MFLQDIEEEPELRQQIDLFRNDDVIKQLESKLAGMNLEEEVEKPSKDEKKGKPAKEERKVTKVARKTQEGKKQ